MIFWAQIPSDERQCLVRAIVNDSDRDCQFIEEESLSANREAAQNSIERMSQSQRSTRKNKIVDVSCGKCKIITLSSFVICSGNCNRCYHLNCVGLSIEAMNAINTSDAIYWFCAECNPKFELHDIHETLADHSRLLRNIIQSFNVREFRLDARPIASIMNDANVVSKHPDDASTVSISSSSSSTSAATTITADSQKTVVPLPVEKSTKQMPNKDTNAKTTLKNNKRVVPYCTKIQAIHEQYAESIHEFVGG